MLGKFSSSDFINCCLSSDSAVLSIRQRFFWKTFCLFILSLTLKYVLKWTLDFWGYITQMSVRLQAALACFDCVCSEQEKTKQNRTVYFSYFSGATSARCVLISAPVGPPWLEERLARDWWCLCPHRWSLNGTLINLGLDRRRRLSGGNLIISSLDRYQDVGMYQCMAFNTVGAILSRRASLQFACKCFSLLKWRARCT